MILSGLNLGPPGDPSWHCMCVHNAGTIGLRKL